MQISGSEEKEKEQGHRAIRQGLQLAQGTRKSSFRLHENGAVSPLLSLVVRSLYLLKHLELFYSRVTCPLKINLELKWPQMVQHLITVSLQLNAMKKNPEAMAQGIPECGQPLNWYVCGKQNIVS